MPQLQRARRLPGLLLLLTLAVLPVTGSTVHAHDPGLSSLDVEVAGGAVSVSLSIAASDVALITAGLDPRLTVTEFARDAVAVSVDGQAIPSSIDEVIIEDGAARVQMSFAISRRRGRSASLSIASDVPNRMTRDHRELIVVTVDGAVMAERLLDSHSGPVTIQLDAASVSRARTGGRFLELGFRHILGGYDHLVFLAGLMLAARAIGKLVVVLTAFTAAHSASLALVVIGGFHAPPSIVEPLIAASIAWVGLENLTGHQGNTHSSLVFGFGLIHGLGFAGALTELEFGSSAAAMALPLVSFNVGVEAGQLAVAAAMLPLVWTIRSRPLWQSRFTRVCSVVIVMAGGYWLFERLP